MWGAFAFAAELDPALDARVHCRWMVNLAGGFGRGPPGSVCVFATTMMQPVQLLLDTVSDSAADSGRGDEFSD